MWPVVRTSECDSSHCWDERTISRCQGPQDANWPRGRGGAPLNLLPALRAGQFAPWGPRHQELVFSSQQWDESSWCWDEIGQIILSSQLPYNPAESMCPSTIKQNVSRSGGRRFGGSGKGRSPPTPPPPESPSWTLLLLTPRWVGWWLDGRVQGEQRPLPNLHKGTFTISRPVMQGA